MKFFSILILGLFSSFSVFAESSFEKKISQSLSRLIPDIQVDSIQATPVDGLYQVLIGPDVIYITRDGNYLLRGELFDINGRNLTEDVRADVRAKLINDIDETQYIEFAPEKTGSVIYVFTDIDCTYCRKLHRDVPELNVRGVSVRYLAYPRAGVNSATGRKMRQVWCAEDRQEVLTAAKNRASIEATTCDDSVAEQYELGKKLGVRGTPAIFLQNGRMLQGYMSPDKLIRQMRR